MTFGWREMKEKRWEGRKYFKFYLFDSFFQRGKWRRRERFGSPPIVGEFEGERRKL